MQESLKNFMSYVAVGFEIAGVSAILVGFFVAMFKAAGELLSGRKSEAYLTTKRLFGRSVLLGLEFLVAADLIRTIAVEPTLNNLYVLGLLVLIRTFLSWSLDVEIDGMWPWRKRAFEAQELAEGLEGATPR